MRFLKCAFLYLEDYKKKKIAIQLVVRKFSVLEHSSTHGLYLMRNLVFLYYNTRQYAAYTLLLYTLKVSGVWEIITRFTPEHIIYTLCTRAVHFRKHPSYHDGSGDTSSLSRQQNRIQINLSRVGLFDSAKTSFYVHVQERRARISG